MNRKHNLAEYLARRKTRRTSYVIERVNWKTSSSVLYAVESSVMGLGVSFIMQQFSRAYNLVAVLCNQKIFST